MKWSEISSMVQPLLETREVTSINFGERPDGAIEVYLVLDEPHSEYEEEQEELNDGLIHSTPYAEGRI